MIPGFASAERAWENMTPFESDCTCEGEAFECDECGELSDIKECRGTAHTAPMRELDRDEIAEHFPNQKCPVHGWCPGCHNRNCEDCGGEPDE